jgi:negative regulator of sigma E activity
MSPRNQQLTGMRWFTRIAHWSRTQISQLTDVLSVQLAAIFVVKAALTVP